MSQEHRGATSRVSELAKAIKRFVDDPYFARATEYEIFFPPADWKIIAETLSALSERAVPDGWKLVPVDPTGDMIDAGGKTPKMKILDSYCSTAQLRGAFTEQGLAGPKSDCAIAQSYKAMLAAAPAFTRSATAESPMLCSQHGGYGFTSDCRVCNAAPPGSSAPVQSPARVAGASPAVAAPLSRDDKQREEWIEWLATAGRRDPEQEVKLLNYRDFKALLEAALASRSSVAANKDEPSELVKRISAYSYADADAVAKLEREAAEWKRKFYGEAVDRAPRSATAEFETWFKAEFTYGDGTVEPPHDDSFKDMLRGAWDAGAASRQSVAAPARAGVDVGQSWSGSICSCGKSTLNGPVSCATKDCPMAKLGGYVPNTTKEG